MLTKIFTGTAYRFRHERAYLPSGYTGMCGESCDRNIGARGAFIAEDASHEHECIAWKESCLSYVKDSAEFAYVRNDDYGKEHCNSDFTGFRAKLLPDLPEGIREVITAVTVHPDSSKAKCRNEEIFHYWSLLAGNGKTFIGGDWNRNTEKDNELQRPLIYTFPDIGRTSVGRQLKPYFSKKTPGIGFAQLFRNNRFFS